MLLLFFFFHYFLLHILLSRLLSAIFIGIKHTNIEWITSFEIHAMKFLPYQSANILTGNHSNDSFEFVHYSIFVAKMLICMFLFFWSKSILNTFEQKSLYLYLALLCLFVIFILFYLFIYFFSCVSSILYFLFGFMFECCNHSG